MFDNIFIIFFVCLMVFAGWYITYKIRCRYKWRKKQIRIAGSQTTVSYNDLLKQQFKEMFITDVTIMANDKDAYILIDFDDEEEKWCRIDSFEE